MLKENKFVGDIGIFKASKSYLWRWDPIFSKTKLSFKEADQLRKEILRNTRAEIIHPKHNQ